MRPFTMIGAVIFLMVAAAHLYRAFAELPVTIADHEIPLMASWIAGGISGLLGVMMLVESRR